MIKSLIFKELKLDRRLKIYFISWKTITLYNEGTIIFEREKIFNIFYLKIDNIKNSS